MVSSYFVYRSDSGTRLGHCGEETGDCDGEWGGRGGRGRPLWSVGR